MLRIILRKARQKYTREEFDLFNQLETHLDEIRELHAGQRERVELTAKAVKLYSMCDMEEEAIVALGAQVSLGLEKRFHRVEANYALVGVKVELNAFCFTDQLYDYIGVYLHPYAALINHSCDYNSVVVFDGEELSVKAVRPIKKGEQIFISYIDTTYPYDTRRKELSERYFFHCRCSKCLLGTDALGDGYIETAKDNSFLEAAFCQASTSINAARDDSDAESALEKLNSARHVLSHAGAWPITRQPYVALRDELITTFLSLGQLQTAFAHAAVRHIKVYPVIYPPSHPIRYVHAWTMVKLAIHLSQETNTDSSDEIPVAKFDIDFDLVAWFTLCTLINKESESCIAPSFKEMVTSIFSEVHKRFAADGVDPSKVEGLVNTERLKIDKLASEVLEKE